MVELPCEAKFAFEKAWQGCPLEQQAVIEFGQINPIPAYEGHKVN